MIERILSADRYAEARAAAPTAVDPIQQTLIEELKDALRRQSVDREETKRAIRFLGQPMGRSLHLRLKSAWESWTESRDDAGLLVAVSRLAEEFSKDRPAPQRASGLRREELSLICFEYVSG